jgi:hypothetical protein
VTDSTWLESLKPGDEVVYEGGYTGSLSLARVASTSKAFVTVSGLKFRKVDGRISGGNGFSGVRILPVTPERRRAIERKHLVWRLHDVKWEDYEDATLEAVAALVWPSTERKP